MAILEAQLLQAKIELTNETQNVEWLAKDLNVPDEIIKDVYDYTNAIAGRRDEYQPYIKAVLSRDEHANFISLLEAKIASTKSSLQNK